MSPLEDVRARMIAFADGRTTPAAFRGWLAGRTWDIGADESPSAVLLLRRAEMLVAEHGRRHITLAALRSRIRDAAGTGRRQAATGLLVRETPSASRPPRRRA
jgi:hypothetical protein